MNLPGAFVTFTSEIVDREKYVKTEAEAKESLSIEQFTRTSEYQIMANLSQKDLLDSMFAYKDENTQK